MPVSTAELWLCCYFSSNKVRPIAAVVSLTRLDVSPFLLLSLLLSPTLGLGPDPFHN